MTSEVAGEIADAPTKSVETDEMSEAAFLRSRTVKGKEPEEQSEATEPPEEAPAAKDESLEEKEPPKESDVLSKARQGDLESLTAEELDSLAKLTGSKAVARFGELTAKRKQAEEKAAMLEQELARRNQAQAEVEPVANNPFASVSDRKELTDKARSIDETLEQIEAILDNTEGIGADDVAHKDSDGSYTRAQLKQFKRHLKSNREKFIPARLRELDRADAFRAMEQSFMQKAKSELDWMGKDDSDAAKAFKEQMSDPRIERLRKVDPELAAIIPYYVARATDSMYARRPVVLDDKAAPAPKAKPPASPAASQAAPERRAPVKEIEDSRKRFLDSGSESDFLNLRTKQISRRLA